MPGRIQIELPLTYTGRKYGYITWRKRHDSMVQSLFDHKEFTNLVIENALQKKKRIDWKKRRIGITYSLTRSVPKSKRIISISKDQTGRISVTFK